MLVVIFAQCGKDDEKVDDLIKVSVFQTMWEGTLKDSQGKEYAVRLLFDYESFIRQIMMIPLMMNRALNIIRKVVL